MNTALPVEMRHEVAIVLRAILEEVVPTLNVSVVPGSGTDDLAGISGRMTITTQEPSHSYDFEYSLGSP